MNNNNRPPACLSELRCDQKHVYSDHSNCDVHIKQSKVIGYLLLQEWDSTQNSPQDLHLKGSLSRILEI